MLRSVSEGSLFVSILIMNVIWAESLDLAREPK